MKMLDCIHRIFLRSDRLRTTNNILGDCYACAIVEHLSQKELTISNDEMMMLKQESICQ